MNWINLLERKLGRFAIPGLIRIVVALNAGVFVLLLRDPDFVYQINLDPDAIMHGQVWRLITYIFIPSRGDSWLMPNFLWIAFWFMFLWMIGDGLEVVWGAFKLNLYYFIGMAGTTIAALYFGYSFNSWILNLSLIFAFATIDPDYPIFFIFFPMKIKWSALISAAFLALQFFKGDNALRAAIAVSLTNYLIFFGPELMRMARHGQKVASRRQRFRLAAAVDEDSLHRCEVCSRTEISDPDLEFRVSSDGHEYCIEHLPAKPAAGK